jgi:hypothetical protein
MGSPIAAIARQDYFWAAFLAAQRAFIFRDNFALAARFILLLFGLAADPAERADLLR